MADTISVDDDLDLESALGELERVVQVLESDGLSIEDSLKIFERGISLVRLCNASLEKAEQKIDILTGDLPEDLCDRR